MKYWNDQARCFIKHTIPSCQPGAHSHRERPPAPPPDAALERAARIYRALGDAPRLRILLLLTRGECCVTEIVAAVQEKFSTVSQRLRILRNEGLVVRRREGTHLFYALADRHVADLIDNALAHGNELDAVPARAVPEGDVKE